MKKITILYVVLIILFTACSTNQSAPTEPAPTATQETIATTISPTPTTTPEPEVVKIYTSKTENFSIAYPDDPHFLEVIERSEPMQNETISWTNESVAFETSQNANIYMVNVSLAPGLLVSPDSRLDGATFENAINNLVLRIASGYFEIRRGAQIREIDLDGFPGREFDAQLYREGLGEIKVQGDVYMIHNRLYMIVAMLPPHKEKMGAEFVKSFEILEKPEPVLLEDWEQFTAEEGDFELMLPTYPIKGLFGLTGRDRMYSVADDQANILIYAMEQTVDPNVTFEQEVDQMMAQLISDSSAEHLDTQVIEKGDRVGVQMTIRYRPSGLELQEIGTFYFEYGGTNLYVLSISMPEDNFDEAKVSQLVGSMKVLQAPVYQPPLQSTVDPVDYTNEPLEYYEAAEDNFQVLYPPIVLEVLETTEPIPTAVGEIEMSTVEFLSDWKTDFIVLHGRIPSFLVSEDEQTILANFREIAQGLGSELPAAVEELSSENRDIDLQGFIGQESVIEFADPETEQVFVLVTRIYLVNERFYLVLTKHIKGSETEGITQAFQDSFQLYDVDFVEKVVWQSYTFEAAEMVFQMPRPPVEASVDTPTPAGPITFFTFTSENNLEDTFVAGYYDLPPTIQPQDFDVDAALDEAVSNIVANIQGDMVGSEIVDYEGFFGRRFTAEIPPTIVPAGATFYGETYFINGRMYQLVAVVMGSDASYEQVAPFFESFEVDQNRLDLDW